METSGGQVGTTGDKYLNMLIINTYIIIMIEGDNYLNVPRCPLVVP